MRVMGTVRDSRTRRRLSQERWATTGRAAATGVPRSLGASPARDLLAFVDGLMLAEMTSRLRNGELLSSAFSTRRSTMNGGAGSKWFRARVAEETSETAEESAGGRPIADTSNASPPVSLRQLPTTRMASGYAAAPVGATHAR